MAVVFILIILSVELMILYILVSFRYFALSNSLCRNGKKVEEKEESNSSPKLKSITIKTSVWSEEIVRY